MRAVRETLVSWFRENGRDLPWRNTRDPWRILVSEVMLQQIQVKRAVPFYERFTERFPTVESLAASPIAEAIRAWGDLGRYKRIVNLHRASRLIVEEHGGEVPSDPETLAKLPGVGPYTAGAVACFAHEKDVAFADTNMRRALHRLFAGCDLPKPLAKEREILALAERLVPTGGGWEWNQSLMEFGAVVCKARNPACENCPLRENCRARPGIKAALAETPRRKGGSGERYEGSNRHYRGKILAELRDSSPDENGIAVRELGVRIRGEDFGERDVPRLYEIVESLEKDGLAVAEERGEYRTGGTDETRVRLP
jgi:A/G-specific adenine glycosylase